MYRRGIVSEVDGSAYRIRCTFPERQDLVSPWLDVLTRTAHTDRDYRLPALGSQVAVLFDEGEASGCVLGALYSESDPPPETDPGKAVLEFGDGGRVEYSDGILSITLPGGGQLQLCGADSAVALASLIEPQLQAIKDDLAAHTHPAGALIAPPGTAGGPVTGATAAPASITYAPEPVGSEQVKSS